MICKGFTKSLEASEHLLGILAQAAKDEEENSETGDSGPCESTIYARAFPSGCVESEAV